MLVSRPRRVAEVIELTFWTQRGARRMDGTVDRYKLALSLLTLSLIPLFYVSIWLGLAAVIAIYSLIARLANKDFDRQRGKHVSLLRNMRKR